MDTNHKNGTAADNVAMAETRTATAAPASFISTIGLRKSFQMGTTMVHALADVDMTIDEGTFQSIMGPSSSGKSTLLYLLGGLDRPTAGRIIVGGHHLEQLDENALAGYRRRFVGFIFQSFNLIPSPVSYTHLTLPTSDLV